MANLNKKLEEEIKCYDTFLQNIEDICTSINYDTSNLDNGNDEIIETEKLKKYLLQLKIKKII